MCVLIHSLQLNAVTRWVLSQLGERQHRACKLAVKIGRWLVIVAYMTHVAELPSSVYVVFLPSSYHALTALLQISLQTPPFQGIFSSVLLVLYQSIYQCIRMLIVYTSFDMAIGYIGRPVLTAHTAQRTRINPSPINVNYRSKQTMTRPITTNSPYNNNKETNPLSDWPEFNTMPIDSSFPLLHDYDIHSCTNARRKWIKANPDSGKQFIISKKDMKCYRVK